MPDHTAVASPTATCSLAATLEAIGDRWTLLILRDLFRGVRRFEDLQRDLGIARNLLSNRLNKLIYHEIVERQPYQQRPIRHQYILTAKGRDLSPALIALMHWGDTWYAEEGPPTLLVHQTCGTPQDQTVHCSHCHQDITAQQISSRPGPGHTPQLRNTP